MGGGRWNWERNDVWRSNDKGISWTQVTRNAEWKGRNGLNSVVMPDGSIVLMGGTTASEIRMMCGGQRITALRGRR